MLPATAAGVNVETIRFYQRRGLLAVPDKPRAGHRRYPAAAVGRIRFIKRAQGLGFSLDEIGELLQLADGTDRASIRRIAGGRLAQVEAMRLDLGRMQRVLRELLEACEHAHAGLPCPIIATLAGRRA